MGCGEASCSGCCWKLCGLPGIKCVECIDEMDVTDKPYSRVSRRDHSYRFSRSKVTCFWAFILILLSVALYLDRTLELHVGWGLRAIDERWGLKQSNAQLREMDLNQPEKPLLDRSYGDVKAEPRTMPTVAISRAKATGALHGMGVTFRKGSRAMSELVVAHLDETTTPHDLRLFLRTLHRSGVTARADIVFLFPRGPDDELTSVLDEEERSFWRLMLAQQFTVPVHKRRSSKNWQQSNFTSTNFTGRSIFMMPNSSIITRFNLTGLAFRRLKEAAAKRWDFRELNLTSSTPSQITNNASKIAEAIICPFNFPAYWQSREEGIQGKGRRVGGVMWKTNEQSNVHGSSGDTSEGMATVVKWGDWGSMVGFDMQDLERDEAITGFIDNPPTQLRRWMCYKMLLGMVKRHYQTVLLTEVGGVVILGDVMSETRDPSFGSSIYLFNEDRSWNEVHLAQENSSMESDNGVPSLRDKDKPKKSSMESDNLPSSRDANKSKNIDKQFPGEMLGNDDQKSAESFKESSQQVYTRNGRHHLSFIYDVYGKQVWRKLEEEDKQKALLSTGIIMGNMKSIQILSNAMLTEIIRVAAIVRKSHKPFHDQPLLNYLVLKSAVLNRKVSEKLVMLSNGASFVHSLPGSKQKSLFIRDKGGVFRALQGLKHDLVTDETSKMIVASIQADICSSQAGVYADCSSPSEN